MSTSYDKYKDQVESARRGNGEFGTYAAGESAVTLATGEDRVFIPAVAGSGPPLTDQQLDTLRKDDMERGSWHESEEQLTYEEYHDFISASSRAAEEFADLDAETQDYVRATANEHNAHVAARIAYEAPSHATIAEVYTDTGQVGAYYDRDGNVIEHLPDHGHAETISLPEVGIDHFPGQAACDPEVDTEANDDHSEYIDLAAARSVSDQIMTQRRDSGADAPPERSDEVKGLQDRATLRAIDTDSDEIETDDHIEVWAGGAAVTSGRVGVPAHEEVAVRIEHEDVSSVTGYTDITEGTLNRDGVTAYTDRQRELHRAG